MVCIVISARKLGVNPDNIATPIAASLGDLITLSILAFVSSFFYKYKGRGSQKGGVRQQGGAGRFALSCNIEIGHCRKQPTGSVGSRPSSFYRNNA